MLQVSLKSDAIAYPIVHSGLIAGDSEEAESLWVPRAGSSGPVPPAEQPQRPPGLLDLPEKPEPVYFTASELHIRPSPIGTVLQEEPGRIYPDSSSVLLIRINEEGRPDHAEILSSTNEVLAREALRAFASARYVPGAIAGSKVKSELRVEVISSNQRGLLLRQGN